MARPRPPPAPVTTATLPSSLPTFPPRSSPCDTTAMAETEGQTNARQTHEGQTPEDMVLYDVVEPHIARITFNRPHRRNAILTPDMNIEFAKKLQRAEDDDDIKVIILAGAGEHFCSGEDVTRVPVESFGLKKGQRLPQS